MFRRVTTPVFAPSLAAVLAICVLPVTAQAQADRPVPDTYRATTTHMTPDGLGLKIDVIGWSDDAARAAVVAALSAEEGISKALSELPTTGVVWLDGSGAGYAVKYAHRQTSDDGSERITLVTDKPVGSYNFKPWTVAEGAVASSLEYSVIELHLDAQGKGNGTTSLVADVALDPEAQTVSLEAGDSTPNVLTDVTLEPKPYWAKNRGH
jgi:hypothetical protein